MTTSRMPGEGERARVMVSDANPQSSGYETLDAESVTYAPFGVTLHVSENPYLGLVKGQRLFLPWHRVRSIRPID